MNIQRENRLFFCLMALAACLTVIAYRYIESGWIDYRQGENAYSRGDFVQAISLYEESFRKGVQAPFAIARLAEAYFKAHKYDKAIYWYKAYLALKPGDPWAKRALAGAMTASGKYDEAEKVYGDLLENKAP